MANETLTVETKAFDELLKSVNSYGADVEKVLNNYIHDEAPRKLTPSIEGFVPVSNRNKTHAKNSSPFGRQENYNLAVKVITSKPFNYLVFPDEALGTSVNNQPQNFTGRGLDAAMPDLINEMSARLVENFK